MKGIRESAIRTHRRHRDSSLSYTVEALGERRMFRHLTEKAIRSFLLNLPQTDGYGTVVRDQAPGWEVSGRRESSPPKFAECGYGSAVAECPTCKHRAHSIRWRSVHVAPDAATRTGRHAYASGLSYDIGNAAAVMAWRLGVSCVVCGRFCGRRKDQSGVIGSVLGPIGAIYDPLCSECVDNERRDIRKWMRQQGTTDNPPAEWLLLMAAERMRKSVRAA